MPEVDPTITAIPVSSGSISTQSLGYAIETEEGYFGLRPTRKHYAGILPAVALSLFFSTASVLNDPRIYVLYYDSSVRLSPQRADRRRISLAEARQIALDVVRIAEQRRAKFAELEGTQFVSLCGWTEQ